jgi:gamma-glutamyltranspeptidase/glutathione hydrolase
LNASGWSPQGLTREFLEGQGFTKMPTNGIHSVTVPGCVDGWAKLSKRFGKKKLSQLLQPAIEMAERGFPVTELDASYWKGSEKKLAKTTNAVGTYMPHATPLKSG